MWDIIAIFSFVAVPIFIVFLLILMVVSGIKVIRARRKARKYLDRPSGHGMEN